MDVSDLAFLRKLNATLNEVPSNTFFRSAVPFQCFVFTGKWHVVVTSNTFEQDETIVRCGSECHFYPVLQFSVFREKRIGTALTATSTNQMYFAQQSIIYLLKAFVTLLLKVGIVLNK